MALPPKDQFLGSINLKGSAQIVAEFFYYGINSILYQRGIYPADTFKRAQKYGTTILVTADEKVNNYLTPLIAQVEALLTAKQLQKLIVLIGAVQTDQTLERWIFDVTSTEETEEKMDLNKSDDSEHHPHEPGTSPKSDKKINHEIADVIRQITASVTFLPLLDMPCSFDVLLYTDQRPTMPKGWSETIPLYVFNSRDVQLRHFSTGLHSIGTKVTYKEEDG